MISPEYGDEPPFTANRKQKARGGGRHKTLIHLHRERPGRPHDDHWTISVTAAYELRDVLSDVLDEHEAQTLREGT